MISPEIYFENINGKNVLIVEVFPGATKPYYLKSDGKNKGTYVRTGATNRLADEEMILDLERQKRNISFDEEVVNNKKIDDLDIEKLKTDFSYLTGKTLSVEDLFNLKIMTKVNNDTYPTVGRILLAGKDDFMEYARIKCARFKGNDVNEFIDQKEFGGAIYIQAEMAMNFVKTYLEKSVKLEGLQRKDNYAIPLDAVREALINAIVHRDYSISGADIKLAIFDDRIEITSPGNFPKSLDINDILSGRSEIRNKVLARFFREINYIEQWGTGIRKIITLCEENGLKRPLFLESGMFVKVILYKDKVSESVGKVAESSGK